jgi:hypothetical protein
MKYRPFLPFLLAAGLAAGCQSVKPPQPEVQPIFPTRAVIYSEGVGFLRYELAGNSLATAPPLPLPSVTVPESISVFADEEPVLVHHFLNEPLRDEEPLRCNPCYTCSESSSKGSEEILTREKPRRPETYPLTWDLDGRAPRQVRVECLVAKMRWKPSYRMVINQEGEVAFDYHAGIENAAVELPNVDLHLILGNVRISAEEERAGRVPYTGAGGMMGGAGEAAEEAEGKWLNRPAQAVNIFYVYDLGQKAIRKGSTTTIRMLDKHLPVEKVYVWDAREGEQVRVTYRVKNATERPLPKGVVRAYQWGLYLGSDELEETPPGAVGSVTIGNTADTRVQRERKVKAARKGYTHEVTLRIENFGDVPLYLKVLDRRDPEAKNLHFSDPPSGKTGEVYAWKVTVPPKSKKALRYSFWSPWSWGWWGSSY